MTSDKLCLTESQGERVQGQCNSEPAGGNLFRDEDGAPRSAGIPNRLLGTARWRFRAGVAWSFARLPKRCIAPGKAAHRATTAVTPFE